MAIQIEVREETAVRLQAMANALHLSLDDYLNKIATFVPPQPSPGLLPADPAFTLTFRDYLALSAAERKAMALELQERYRDWIERQLEARQAVWLMVIGGQVLEASPRLADYPTSERLLKLGAEHDLVPFVFSRPPLFEESSWSVLRGDDFYPTLALTIGADEWEHAQLLAQGRRLSADFDTGSPYLFLNWDWLLAAGLVEATPVDFPQAWHHLGRRYISHPFLARGNCC